MLKIKKETVKKTTINLEIEKSLENELKTYLKVAKANKYVDNTTTVNDIIEEALKQLINNEEYQTLKSDFEALAEAKREKMRIAKQKQREKKKAEAEALINAPMSKEAIKESVAHSEGTKPHKKGNKAPNK